MRLLLYYVTHTFINSIKKLFRTWVIIFIACMLLFGFLFGFGAAALADMFGEDEQIETEVESEEESEQSLKEEMRNMSKEERDTIYQVISCIVFLAVLSVVLFNIYTSQRGGTEIFTMADVNFLFTSPMRPQSVLLFKTILQMGIVIVSSVYIVFQIPNLVINVGLGIDAAIFLIVMWLVAVILGKLCGIFVYTLTATKLELRKYIRPFVFAVLLLLVAGVSIVARTKYAGIWETVLSIFSSKVAFAVPFVGWSAGIVHAYLYKSYEMLVVYSILMVVGLVLCIFGIWRMRADFYEDALASANKTQEMLEAAESGMQRERKRSDKLKRDSEIGRGEGASAFFYKQLFNRKRFAKFGVLTTSMMVYLGCVLLIYAFCMFFGDFPGVASVIGVLFLVMIFFKNYVSPIAVESGMNFIYMIPETPFSKIGYIMLAEIVECFMDFLPAMIATKLLFDTSVLQVVQWLFVIISFVFILSATSLFIDSVLSTSLPDTIKALFLIFLKFAGVLPMVIVIIVFAVMDLMAFAFAISVVVNVLVGMILVFISSLLLHVGKK